MVGLGDLPGGTDTSMALAVSGDGMIVTGYGSDVTGRHAIVWDQKHGMRELQSVLSSEYGVAFPGWSYLEEARVAADGRSVVGEADNEFGERQVFNGQINSRTYRFMSGETYAGFHTSRLGGLGTTVDLLAGTAGGTAGSFRTVTVDLLAMPSVQFAPGFASDVIDVSGTGMDTFVLRLGYDEASAISFYGAEVKALLGWFDPGTGTWKNAVDGNTGGTATFAGDRAYNSGTDTLGSYGVDTANNQVWAVINHNSQFGTVPEPGSAGLLALGAAVIGWRRRR